MTSSQYAQLRRADSPERAYGSTIEMRLLGTRRHGIGCVRPVGLLHRSVTDQHGIAELVVAEQRRTDRRTLRVPDAHRRVQCDLHDATAPAPSTGQTTCNGPAWYQPGSGPGASLNSGTRRMNSSTAMRTSRRARCEPMQRCGPMPNATCRPSRRSRWNSSGVLEHRLVAVRRAEQQQDPLAGLQLLPRHLGVAGDGPGEGRHRRVQPQRLLDQVGDGGRVGDHGREVLGVDGEMPQRRADAERRVLEAGDEHEAAEVEHLVVGVRPAVDGAGHHQRDEVVTGRLARGARPRAP